MYQPKDRIFHTFFLVYLRATLLEAIYCILQMGFYMPNTAHKQSSTL